MQNDKEHLDVDLGFLDAAKPRYVETKATSSYKVNWRNITVIGGIIAAFIGWIVISDNSSPNRSTPSSSYGSPTTYQPQAPAYRPPAADAAGTVTNGQFRCSSYDSRQADLLAPTNDRELMLEKEEMKSRSDQLDSLKLKIDTSGVTSYSDQAEIDRYNAMVARYNRQLTSWKADYMAHQARIDTYNQQVQARNNYLLTNCRRSR